MSTDLNVWGTIAADINADEYCQRCEREVPFHYDNCDRDSDSEPILCVCCEPARAVIWSTACLSWEHVDDSTWASRWHAHLCRDSRDCDGRMTRSWIEPGTVEVHEHYDVWDRTLSFMVSAAARDGATLTIEPYDAGKDASADWSQRTDEGYSNLTARMCEDACDLGERDYRDYAAEAAGY